MKAGLEVHQQLATGKLFCDCPSELSETVAGSFARRLRSASGENRAVDPAAAFQAARGLLYRYEIAESSCLVEMDEEPPHPLNPAALEVALTLALLLEARPVDEISVMRKIVVDGSNTAGFQRTALVAVDGHLELHGKRYSIASICLEEDAARKVRESDGEVTYRLDRLGIPLIEIATGPEIEGGGEAREVAEEIGALLRATRQTRRGIGTIREDVNVSAEGGRRIEIKGVQELRKIQEYVDREVGRQKALLGVRDELVRRGVAAQSGEVVDVTPVLAAISSGPLSSATRKGGPILALRLPGFAGLLRASAGSDERLGRELADHARTFGLRGLLHSDELPAYGVEASHVERLRSDLGLGPNDAFVLVTDRDRSRAEGALARVAARTRAALEGIPGETRDPLPDGRTRYSRPLPGRERMYPETDIPPIPITAEHLARLAARLPERPTALRERLSRETGLANEVVLQLVAGGRTDLFEELVRGGPAGARRSPVDPGRSGGSARRGGTRTGIPARCPGRTPSGGGDGKFRKGGDTGGAPRAREGGPDRGDRGRPRRTLRVLVRRTRGTHRASRGAERSPRPEPRRGSVLPTDGRRDARGPRPSGRSRGRRCAPTCDRPTPSRPRGVVSGGVPVATPGRSRAASLPLRRFRVVVTDVDGTLTGADRRLVPRAMSAVRWLESHGIPVVLATGNVLPIALGLHRSLGLSGPIVAENGGLLYRTVDGQERIERLADRRVALEAYRALLAAGLPVRRLFTDRWRETEVGLEPTVPLARIRRVLALRGIPVQPIATGFAIHLMERGAGKLPALRRALRPMGLRVTDCVVLGDGDNDVGMLRASGFGVSFASGSPRARRAARYVARSSFADGFVEGLKASGIMHRRRSSPGGN